MGKESIGSSGKYVARLTDGVEETIDLQVLLLSGLDILDLKRLQQVAISLALGSNGLHLV
jgi:hypothetical protein